MIYMRIMISALIMLLIAPSACAINIDLSLPEIDHATFTVGDTIKLESSITNIDEKDVDIFYLESYGMPGGLERESLEVIDLGPDETHKIEYPDFTVFPLTKSGEYSYSIEILDTGLMTVKYKEIDFMINGTKETFPDTDIYFCSDINCSEVKSVFTEDEEKAYIFVENEREPLITVQVTYPDYSVDYPEIFYGIGEIDFKGAGKYGIEITLQEEGYQTMTFDKAISVIEKEPEIHALYCATEKDGICDSSCPDDYDPDCMVKETEHMTESETGSGIYDIDRNDGASDFFSEQSSSAPFLIIIAVLIIIIAGSIIYIKRRKRQHAEGAL